MPEEQEKPYACCPACALPLVSTLEFYKKEWICMNCPRLLEWLEPLGIEATPEVKAKYAEHEAKYDRGRDQRRREGTHGDWSVAREMIKNA